MSESQNKINPYENVKKIIDRVAGILSLTAELVARLKQPINIFIKNFPVRMDDGQLKIFTGYRVQYNISYPPEAGAPYKGGVRFHPNVDLDEVIALAAWMFFKVEVMNLLFGGAKGGIQCDPKHMSKGEIERMTRGYTHAFKNVFGPKKDVPAPDIYTNPQVMAWILSEYSKSHCGENNFGVVTGKPVELGGSLGRSTATARGGDFVLEYAVEKCLIPRLGNFDGKTCIIQGFGNAGQPFADFMLKRGVKIIGVSDSGGGVFNPQGLDIGLLQSLKKQRKSITEYQGGTIIPETEGKKILELPCDILVPAAIENQITAENADCINAKVIVELANGPTTPEADEILYKKGIVVLPDILANAGGVTVSYFEWEQNMGVRFWLEQEVDDELRRKMCENAEEVFARARKYNVNNRLGAYILAIERASKRIEMRGSE